MASKDVLKKIYQGGLQDHHQEDDVKVYLNNLRNDCVEYCIKELTKKTLSEEERECSKNFMAKNFYLLNSNPNITTSKLLN
jgi:hypothetical protein